jgi:hypothetical protein
MSIYNIEITLGHGPHVKIDSLKRDREKTVETMIKAVKCMKTISGGKEFEDFKQ